MFNNLLDKWSTLTPKPILELENHLLLFLRLVFWRQSYSLKGLQHQCQSFFLSVENPIHSLKPLLREEDL